MNALCNRVSYKWLLKRREKKEPREVACPLAKRLCATLQFLVTGQAFEDMKFTDAVAYQILGRIFLQTREGIERKQL